MCLVTLTASAPAADYAAQFVSGSQSPEGLNLPYVAGQTATFQLSYKNTGTVYWNNTRDVSDPHSIELRSVTAADSTTQTDSLLFPGQGPAPLWVNRQRVVGPNQSRVDPNQTADFIFTVKIPATAGHYRLYFRPCIYGNFVGQGRYYDLEVTQQSENVDFPTDLIALAAGLTVDLTWQDNSNNEDGFRIEKKIGNNGAYFPFKTLPAGTTSYRDPDVSANWKYFYRVCAFKGNAVSEWVEYYAQVLAAPANLAATVKSQTEIDLVWADNTLGETGFKVYSKLASDAQWTEIAVLTPQTATYTSFPDKALAFDTTYDYGVRAYADSTTPTPHLSDFATVSATTQGLSTEPHRVKTYRQVNAANGHQDHLYMTKFEERNSAETSGYMFDGEDLTYNWTFTDGSSTTGAVVDHTFYYMSGSTQYVTLTVADNLGMTSQAPLAINVTGTSQGTTANQSGYSSEPVNMTTGNYTSSHIDLLVPGRRIPFIFTRSYNFSDPYFRTGRHLGHGWTHSYNLKIVEETRGPVIRQDLRDLQDFLVCRIPYPADPVDPVQKEKFLCNPVTVIFKDGHGEIFTPSEMVFRMRNLTHG